MSFISTQDFSQALFREIREGITRYSETTLTTACLRAEQEIIARLSARYLIKPELEKVGELRDTMLVGICVDIAIYHLYKTQENIPNIRVKAYDDAINLLKALSDGSANLPGVPVAPTEGENAVIGNISYGSRRKRDNDY